jgi:hypothetical protein
VYLNFGGFGRCIMQQQAINKSQEYAYLWSSPTSKCSTTLLKLKSKWKCEIFANDTYLETFMHHYHSNIYANAQIKSQP